MSGVVIVELSAPPLIAQTSSRWRPIAVLLGVALCATSALVVMQALPALASNGWDGWRSSTSAKPAGLSADALPAGQEGAMALFACRGAVGQDVHIGRIRADFAGCHIGFDGKEVELANYETLSASWASQAPTSSALLAGSVRDASTESGFDVTRVYACRAAFQGGIHSGQLVEGLKQCSFGFGGKSMTATSYEVLQAAPWSGWVGATARDIPATAIPAGSEGGEQFYVCRAADADGLHPGKVKRSSSGCSIASDSREVIMERFEVLASRWLPGRSGTLPVSAVPAGREGGRPQYVCRAKTRDGVEIGKTNEALNGCHIGMLGREVIIDDYQVLSQ